jgi:integrase
MLVADYLPVAARKAAVVAPPRTFGFHTFRRTLASVLLCSPRDPASMRQSIRLISSVSR